MYFMLIAFISYYLKRPEEWQRSFRTTRRRAANLHPNDSMTSARLNTRPPIPDPQAAQVGSTQVRAVCPAVRVGGGLLAA
jgi:hypothetical protein